MRKALEGLGPEKEGIGSPESDILTGWRDIAEFLGVSQRTAQRYAVAGLIQVEQLLPGGAVFASRRQLREAVKIGAEK